MNAISTRDLSMLPDIETLRRRFQQMSALQAIFAIEYGSADFEFHAQWGREEQMGSFKNGSGDELYAHFTPAGCFIKGFAHESVMTPYRMDPPALWPGLLSSVPSAFEPSVKEPAFDIASTTFVIWRLTADTDWQTDEIKFPENDDPDGSHELLSKFMMSSSDFSEWLAENYEVEVDAEIVEHVFKNLPLTDVQLRALNPSVAVTNLRSAVQETGYVLG